MNNKDMLTIVIIIFLIGFILVIGIVVLDQFIEGLGYASSSNTQIILGQNSSQHTLTEELLSVNTITTKNQTWLNFDGINDFTNISDNSYDTISFWAKNSTVSWTYIVNTSGILYENGNNVNSLTFYPIFFDGADWQIGKTDATTFFSGSIDSIRFYNNTINSTTIGGLYDIGRE